MAEFRWWISEKLIALAHWVNPEEAEREAIRQVQLRVLSDIALGKVPAKWAAASAYAALY